jgi:RND family efflux transporter MFP subunit
MLRPVKYTVAGSTGSVSARTFSGWARAGKDVTLSFRTAGIIVEKHATKGLTIKKGELLGRLDNVEAQLAYEKAISEEERAKSEMQTAQTNFNRIKYLYEQGAKPLIEYENARNLFTSASSQYQTAIRNRDIQKTKVEYGYIYAPMDGIVITTEGDVNERVSAGHKFVVLNVSDGQIKVTVNLPEAVINSVTLNMPVEVNFSASNGMSFKGTVIEISPDVSEESATYPVDIAITNPTEEIKLGMSANVTFNFALGQPKANPNIIVPINAVGEDSEGKFVYIVQTNDQKTGVVTKTKVEIGTLTTEGFEITNGLLGGEKVVTAGLQSLLDGQKVRLQ